MSRGRTSARHDFILNALSGRFISRPSLFRSIPLPCTTTTATTLHLMPYKTTHAYVSHDAAAAEAAAATAAKSSNNEHFS